MSMELQHTTNGRDKVLYGRGEKFFFSLIASAVVALAGCCVALVIYIYTHDRDAAEKRNQQFTDGMQSIQEKTSKISAQQDVFATKVDTLTKQLADVPGITRDVSALKSEVQRNTDDIKDIRRSLGR